jgi:hypothetical protein
MAFNVPLPGPLRSREPRRTPWCVLAGAGGFDYYDWTGLELAPGWRTGLDDALTRRLSVAMAVSAAVHVVAIVIVGRALTADSISPSSTAPLMVRIDSHDAATEPSSAKVTQHPPRTATDRPRPADRTPVTHDAPVADEATSRRSSATPSVAEFDTHGHAEAASPSARPFIDAAIADIEDHNSNPAIVRHEQSAEELVPIRAQYSARQEKMLGRKVREWTEELHRVPDLTKEISWNDGGQEYVAKFTEQPGDDDMSIERVLVEISTSVDGNRFSSAMALRRVAFSGFAQFVNRWDPDVEIHNDELDGRFHANSRIRLAYDRRTKPVFHAKVTTSAREVDITRISGIVRKSQIFQGGLETGVRAIRLPRHYAPFPDGLSRTDADVHRLTNDVRIEFLPDGSYTLDYLESAAIDKAGEISRDVTYFLADKDTSVHVRGVVNGKVLIYSPKRIVVEGDLVYAQDPRVTPESDDFLGLVSDGHVDVAAPDVTGPGDLVIHAAIYARRRFNVRDIRSTGTSELHLYGSLSAGTVSATEPRYSTRIQFDQRLTEVRPPGFPLTDRYEVESWDKRWTSESSH